MALVSDPTEEGYNSFASLDEATAYFGETYWKNGKNPWTAFNPDEQEALLITASRRLSALPWLGVPLVDAQLLAFPRSYTSYEYGGVTEVGTEANPSWLISATAEMARWTWEESTRPLGDFDLSAIKSVSIDGAISVTFRDGVSAILPSAVMALLKTAGSAYIDLSTGPRSMTMVY